MQTILLLSVSSQDKPGVVEAISSTVESCGANWLESRLAHLSGKFIGVIRVSVENTRASELELSLDSLSEQGIVVSIEAPNEPVEGAESTTAHFSAVGPDRRGIVKEIASALAHTGINVEELETNLSSMPYSGEPIFEAVGMISLPQSIDINALSDKLDAIANDLGLDIDVSMDKA